MCKAFEEIKDMGHAEGLAEGHAEGLAEGLAEGEHKSRVENAQAMLADGMDCRTVAKYSGLPVEEVEALAQPQPVWGKEAVCKAFEEIKDMAHAKGLAEGLAEGKHESRVEIAKMLISMKKNTVQEIAQATGLTVEEVEALEQLQPAWETRVEQLKK